MKLALGLDVQTREIHIHQGLPSSKELFSFLGEPLSQGASFGEKSSPPSLSPLVTGALLGGKKQPPEPVRHRHHGSSPGTLQIAETGLGH